MKGTRSRVTLTEGEVRVEWDERRPEVVTLRFAAQGDARILVSLLRDGAVSVKFPRLEGPRRRRR